MSPNPAFYPAFPFFHGDVSLLGELLASIAAHRSQDEWQLLGVRLGALPLRTLLCCLWDRHRNWAGTGRTSRYEVSVLCLVVYGKKHSQLRSAHFINIVD